MLQVPVSKQGRYQFTCWHDRVATFDTQALCVYLSKKDRVDVPYYHKLYVEKVQLWPHYSTEYVNDSPSSPEAILTLRVSGMALRVSQEDKSRVLAFSRSSGAGDAPTAPGAREKWTSSVTSSSGFSGSTADSSAAAQTSQHSSHAAAMAASPPSTAELVHGKKTEWFLRCCTAEELTRLVYALEALCPQPVWMRGPDGVMYQSYPHGPGGPKMVGDLARVTNAFQRVTAGDWLGAAGI